MAGPLALSLSLLAYAAIFISKVSCMTSSFYPQPMTTDRNRFPTTPGPAAQGVSGTVPSPYLYTTRRPLTEVTLPVGYTDPPKIANRSLTSTTYLLTVPDVAIPGFNLTLAFENFADQPMSVKARVYERVYYRHDNYQYTHADVERVSVFGQFARGSPGLLHLPIPENLQQSSSYFLELSCADVSPQFTCPTSSGNNANRIILTRSLSLVTDVTTIFVQTDKAIYKPGQLVHYRVFAVYPDLHMFHGNFTIQIMDPNQNKIQYLQDAQGREGVVEGSLGLADQPIFGDWTISVEIQTPARVDRYAKKFTVADYQLPRFEVKVNLPSYILTTDQDLKGSVKATYTFGQPVKGKVELHVMSAYARPDSCGNEPRHMELAFDIDGEAKFSIPKTDINSVASVYSGAAVKVTASVKEELTDVSLEGSSTVVFRSTPYKVRILDNTPSVFKPGLPFSVFALGSMVDDSPAIGDNNNITMYVTAHYSIPSADSFLYGTQDFTGTYPLPVQTVITPTGFAKMDLHIPSNATRLDVTVVFQGLTAHKTIDHMFSISDNYLQLTLLDKDLQSGQSTRMQAMATEPMTKLWYLILSRGTVYESKVIDAKGQHSVTFDIDLTPKMAPTAHMMAYYVRPDMEIVPDSIAFNIQGIFENEVTLEMSTNMSEPHADLDVTVTADPFSVVNLLTVDQSVLLLKSGNDVSPDEVSSAIASYDRGSAPSDSKFALSLSRKSISATLGTVGVTVYFDGFGLSMTSKPRPLLPRDPSIFGPDVLPHNIETPGMLHAYHAFSTISPLIPTAAAGFFPGMTAMPGMTLPPHVPNAGQMAAEQKPLKEVDRVRNLFPETWLWTNATVGANGSATIHTTVPDTITSWISTAFATNSKTGLGVTASSSKLTVFRPFFVSLTMPTSVVRGEHVVIQASVFNYLNSDLSVLVSLPGSNDYTSILLSDDGSETMTQGDVKHTVMVKSQEQAAVYFPIIPASVGAVNIEVSARSTLSADAVRRPLTVEAEGVPSEFTIPVFINMNGTGTFSQQFPVSLPDDVIDGSKWSRVKVTGDILGPSINGLENLLRMPTGCGEQNMIKLAPDLYIAEYLTTSGQMTSAMSDRIKYLIQTGYQRELTYQRSDGAFSAFGNKDATGSTWLTSFVLRVFHEARGFVFVDDGVLQKAIDWLAQRQNQDGSFNEFGFIFDPQMRRFKDHSTGLTSFVLISLLENSDVPVTDAQKAALQNAIGNATDFLENNHQAIPADDYLSLALTALALTKVNSPQADVVFSALTAKATNQNGVTFWKVPTNSTGIDPYSRWRPTHVRARPIDIHVTSYALLVYSARGMFQEGMSVLHWLTRQRNPYGGFSSTQDTVVGLQALTEFLSKAAPSGYDLQIDVRDPSDVTHFNVTSKNAMVLQSKDYKTIPSDVTFTATGTGVAIGELDVFFNVEKDLGEPAFEVSTVLLDDYLNSFKIMICTRWLLANESGMVVQEVGIPSGFAPDMTSVGNVAGIKRSEQKGRFLNIYFEKVTKNSLCYTVMFDRQSMVAHSQPSYVITQDYYEPTNRATTSYQSLSLKKSNICDICHDCCSTS